MNHYLVRKNIFRMLSFFSVLLLLFLPTVPSSAVSASFDNAAFPSPGNVLAETPADGSSSSASGSSASENTAAGTESSSSGDDTAGAGTGFHVDAPCAIVMEASTGTVLYEQDADLQKPPASVTKVMTLLLIFEALDAGQISLTDTVTTSEHAASMGGSQVFLEAGESQTVETMIKCIAVASGNDACVAMAEYIAGSEDAFVAKMNERAAALGMTNTHFVNCCGLDADGHYTSARDIAIMSRELTINHPEIFDYTTIWMENITHVTTRGSSEFGLTNTNKLIRQYEGATGLKTGSTSKAGFCLSATATRNDISLIAVVMGCDSSKARIAASASLLDYGFSVCRIFTDNNPPALPAVPVRGGTAEEITCRYERNFSHVATSDLDESKIEKKLVMDDTVKAPVKEGQKIGTLDYYYDGTKLGSVAVLSGETVPKAHYTDYFQRLVLAL